MIVAWGIAVLCTLFLSSCKRPEVLDNSTLEIAQETWL